MKKLLILTSVVMTLIFSGCASSNVNKAKNTDSFKFEKVNNSETIYKVAYSKKGKVRHVLSIVNNTMEKIKKETKKKGYDYFQIVSPKSISNFDGFPITNTFDLIAFLNPQISMPTHKLNFLETKKTLMDNQNSQKAVTIPLTIFQETTFDLVIRLVKEPIEDEIVWDVNNK